MRVFVYEFTCATAMPDHAGGGSLRAEGQAMVSAVLEDFARAPGIEAVTLVADTIAGRLPSHLTRRAGAGAEPDLFRALAAWADYTLVIAPEPDAVLETRCRWVLEAAGKLLGPSPQAVHLAADKWQLSLHLGQRGIPTPATWQTIHSPPASFLPFPIVLKPRHGAGSQATFLVRETAELAAAWAGYWEAGLCEEALVQEFVPGIPASVAFLIGRDGPVALLPAAQHLSEDGRFRYRGGSIPLPPHLAGRAASLARRAVEAMPALQGYIGVDLVLGGAEDGSQDRVIEINPRLTTSYVGLRALAQTNLAEAMLHMVRGESIPPLAWRPGAVVFTADG
jgi:predicted ATP-grasp superfamily ATP-dependent carboligase